MSEKEVRVLLIDPAATRRVYLETNVRAGAPLLPSLGLASIAGALKKEGFSVRILDLDLVDVGGGDTELAIRKTIAEFDPDICGLTSITPTWNAMLDTAKVVKSASPSASTVCGGIHTSLFPDDTMANPEIDMVIRGEADFSLNELISSNSPSDIPGLVYRNTNGLTTNKPRKLIEDLDTLPYPAWELFDISAYGMSRLTERRRPSGYLETSRGCPFGCIYCDKTVFGRTFRAKSPERVAAEFEIMSDRHGFRELHIVDDGFSTDLDRAKEICRLLIERKNTVIFNMFNGVRADRFDDELAELLKKAGCYQVAFGVESGNDRVLESVSKGTSKEIIRRATASCKKFGLETFGFFMIGFPEDTPESVRETIDFAIELDMTISKYDIAVPLPGTALFDFYDARGMLKTRDWRAYIFHRTDEPLFDHPNMSWEEIKALYYIAFRRTYLRLGYIAARFVHGLRTGGLWYNFVYFLKSRWR
ncbi:MAG TPA: radical SAM protein [bacterium]|nr:radical SAM protein [bacterium]